MVASSPCVSRGAHAWADGPAAYWLVRHASDYTGQSLGKKLLGWLENNILIREPSPSLPRHRHQPSVAARHVPELVFNRPFERDPARGITLYLEKKFSMKSYTRWLERQPPTGV